MRLALIFLMAITLSSSPAQDAPQVFGKDARLKVPITMRAKIVSLSDFTAALQKLTTVPCSVAPAIADRKITAIFHDRPAAEVMSAVQDALLLEWVKVGTGYRLRMSTIMERDEEALVQAENEALRSSLLDALRKLANAPDVPQADIDRQLKALQVQMAPLRRDLSPDAPQKLEDLMLQARALYNYSTSGICKALSSDLSGALDSVLDGKTVCASTYPVQAIPRLPDGFMDHIRGNNPDAEGALVMMHFDSNQQAIVGRSMTVFGPRKGASFTIFTIKPKLSSADLTSSKLLVRLQKWAQQVDPQVLDKPVAGGDPVEAQPGYVISPGGGLTLAEHLEYIADHADTPVIGDAFRTYCSGPKFLAETTVLGYVEALKNINHSSLSTPAIGYSAARNGWLFVRYQNYWQRMLREIPESTYQAIESAAQTKDFPSTDDYARFVDGLSFAQLDPMRSNPYSCATRFQARPFQQASGELKLWANLTDDQKSAAGGDGLDLTGLSPSQTEILRDVWANEMWKGTLPVETWAALFSPRGLLDLHPVLKYECASYSHGSKLSSTGTNGSPAVPKDARQRTDFMFSLSNGHQLRDTYVLEPAQK